LLALQNTNSIRIVQCT